MNINKIILNMLLQKNIYKKKLNLIYNNYKI